MNGIIHQLAEFYMLRHHVPITVAVNVSGLLNWDSESIMVAFPTECSQTAFLDEAKIPYEPEFGESIGGTLIQQKTLPVARLSGNALILLFNPIGETGTALGKKIVEDHLRHLSRQFRRQQLDHFVGQIKEYAKGRKENLEAIIRSDNYDLEDAASRMNEAAQRIALNRRLLDIFKASEEVLAKSMRRRFAELLRLVPSQYRQISLCDNLVIGVTYPVIIDHEGFGYEFGSYKITVELGSGQVKIHGGNSVNEHIHPHIAEDKSICWGNIGPLVSRLAGQLDLAGLFQLVLQFLKSYNEGDAYQRIEKWDPEYDEDDREEYCSFCDEFGHSTEDCEYCFWCEHCDRWVDSDGHDCSYEEDEETDETEESEEETGTEVVQPTTEDANEQELVEAA